MNRPIRTLFGLILMTGTIGVGAGAVSAADAESTAPPTTPPPRPGAGTIAAGPPQGSTTCEGDFQCGILRAVCYAVGGAYNGWPSKDPGHGHEHGVCTWPWE